MIETAYQCSACGCLHPTQQVVEECKRINATEITSLRKWVAELKETQTKEHKEALRKSMSDDNSDIRFEMQGMQWTLDMVIEEIDSRIAQASATSSSTTKEDS